MPAPPYPNGMGPHPSATGARIRSLSTVSRLSLLEYSTRGSPRYHHLQAVIWRGNEEHGTCPFSTGANRWLSLVVMHTEKTLGYHLGQKAQARPVESRGKARKLMVGELRSTDACPHKRQLPH
jgi:hypothetical protein